MDEGTGTFRLNMAAFQPEPEKPLHNRYDSSDVSDDERKRVERKGSAHEAAAAEDAVFGEKSDVDEAKDSAEALCSSSLQHGFAQDRGKRDSKPCTEAGVTPDLKPCDELEAVQPGENGDSKSCIDSYAKSAGGSEEPPKSIESDPLHAERSEDLHLSYEPDPGLPEWSQDPKPCNEPESLQLACNGDPMPSTSPKSPQPERNDQSKPCKEFELVKTAESEDNTLLIEPNSSKELKHGSQAEAVQDAGSEDSKLDNNPAEHSPKTSHASEDDGLGLVWSETEDELEPKKSNLKEEDKGKEQMKPVDQATEALSEATGCTTGEKLTLTQDEEEEFTDASVEMEYDANVGEEVKGTETSGVKEGEPKCEVQMKTADEDKIGREVDKVHETDTIEKQKKNRLQCPDCGKNFPRREAYDLHRHFHMHQDEQASLTCKECGLTFQQRSSLIKHRSEHKPISTPDHASNPQKRSQIREFREERGFACDCCGEHFASLIRYKFHACQVSLEKPYRCPLCRKEFQYRVSINAHMQSHSLDSPYRCLECNKGFQCAMTLHIHQRSHAALKPYECPDCGMVFRHRSLMDDHRRKHTDERPHQCKICGKNFKYSSLLQQHQYLHTGHKPYRCAECGKRFAFVQNMRAHCRLHKKLPSSASLGQFIIKNKDSKSIPNGIDLERVGKENTNHDKVIQRNCPLCPQLFYKAADLRVHMLTHEAEYEQQSNGNKQCQTYTCPNCPLQFIDEATLQSHALTHQVTLTPLKREALSVASAVSIDNISGEGEWGDQLEKKPLRCKDCGKTFRYRSVLELHMRIHNRGYQCHVCKKSFRFSSYLQQHLIIHSGKKPYKCPDCGKDFAFLQNMKTHQRLHQQKPFRCTQCRKGYSDESQLQRHMLCHSGDKPYKCTLCNKSFGLAYLLRDHLNTHTGERPHRCQECHKSFPWLSSLLVHQKIHARKRQAMSQSYSSILSSQRGKSSGLGKYRRSWSKMGENVESPIPTSFPDSVLQGSIPKIMGQESSAFDSDVSDQTPRIPVQLQQQWQIQITSQMQQQPTWLSEVQTNKHQWQTHLKPILPKPEGLPKHTSQQQAQVATGPRQISENCTAQDNSDMANSSSPTPSPSKGNSSCSADGLVPLDLKTHSASNSQNSPNQELNIQGQPWTTVSDLTQNTKGIHDSSNKTSFEFKVPGSTKLADTVLDKPLTTDEQQSSLSNSTPIRQSTNVESDITTFKHNKPLSVVTPLDMSKIINLQEKPEVHVPPMHIMQSSSQQLQLVLQPQQQMQLLHQAVQQMQPEQLNQMKALQLFQQQQHQSQSNQLGSVSVQFGATPFAHGSSSAVFGFQTTQVVPQALLNGPVQQGPQQQSPLVSASQILLNQASPFISSPLSLAPPLTLPAPHPIHSIAGQLPGAAAQGIFFTPRGVMNERAVIPQALSSPHVAHRFRCMVCGCTLPGELELQVHYMQHAQGEV